MNDELDLAVAEVILQRTIVLIILILFLLLPILFIAPEFDVTSLTQGYSPNPVYEVDVDTDLPVDRIIAEIDGQFFPVYEEDSKVYKIQPTVNGEMTVTTTLINHQTMSHTITVDNVDRQPPVMVSTSTQKDTVTLYLADRESGIDYSELYAVDTSGQRVAPKSYDEDFGKVVFGYPEDTLNLFVTDRADNKLQLIISPAQ